ncbi:MAG TPA: hypothetical protein VD994_03460 [Prosthecobacter sp.]|nr:hypothetical protein [Prosthecobacter sp.]
MTPPLPPTTRRQWLNTAAGALASSVLARQAFSQDLGARPPERPAGTTVLNPRGRVPVSIIIDDSTCLVNLNKFAVPQFAAVSDRYGIYNWRSWPDEIPDDFVRKFADWAGENGVKGKYSIVPYPACVGRLDGELPGWTHREVAASIRVVQERIMPNWDIHPEMVTHTRVINTKTGHPYPERSMKFMENWDWSVNRSVDELTDYLSYALTILKNVGLPCEGVTTPGGFGSRARPQLAQATLESCRSVFNAEIPHYFRDLHAEGTESVAPKVYYASGLGTEDPRCSVSILGCTGDWTGGWNNTPPEGVDKFITADLQSGRLVDVIGRAEPAIMVCHWTGIHWNGQELGFKIFQEVVRRLHQRYDHLVWMKLSEIARYWAAKELTTITTAADGAIHLEAPYHCPQFTLQVPAVQAPAAPRHVMGDKIVPFKEVAGPLDLQSGTWTAAAAHLTVCFDLPKGRSTLRLLPHP